MSGQRRIRLTVAPGAPGLDTGRRRRQASAVIGSNQLRADLKPQDCEIGSEGGIRRARHPLHRGSGLRENPRHHVARELRELLRETVHRTHVIKIRKVPGRRVWAERPGSDVLKSPDQASSSTARPSGACNGTHHAAA